MMYKNITIGGDKELCADRLNCLLDAEKRAIEFDQQKSKELPDDLLFDQIQNIVILVAYKPSYESQSLLMSTFKNSSIQIYHPSDSESFICVDFIPGQNNNKAFVFVIVFSGYNEEYKNRCRNKVLEILKGEGDGRQ